MKMLRLSFLGLALVLATFWHDPCRASPGTSWEFGKTATAKPPTVTEYREFLPDISVKEIRKGKVCFCEEGELCECGPDCNCNCVRVKSLKNKANVKKPSGGQRGCPPEPKVSWDWSKSEVCNPAARRAAAYNAGMWAGMSYAPAPGLMYDVPTYVQYAPPQVNYNVYQQLQPQYQQPQYQQPQIQYGGNGFPISIGGIPVLTQAQAATYFGGQQQYQPQYQQTYRQQSYTQQSYGVPATAYGLGGSPGGCANGTCPPGGN